MALILCGFLCLSCIINLVFPDKKISTAENRSLQTFPKISVDGILSGSFNDSLSTWYSDQFIGRNTFIHINYLFSKMMGIKKIDDVYLGKKGMLIEECADVNEEQLARNLNAINAFYDTHQNITQYFMLAPNSVNIKSNNLPSFVKEDQNSTMDSIYSSLSEGIYKLDVREALNNHKDEYLYYKSDHHWTSLAAFYAFQAVAPLTGCGEVSENDFDNLMACNDFKGTLAHKVGSISISDSIDIYVAKNNPDYICTNNGTSTRSIYSEDGLKSNDAYTVFFGGNAAKITIEIDNASDRHLLIFKDSYANSYVQFLLPYYRTITIVDPRYYVEDINRIIQGDLITDVMYLYNSNTFVQDTSLADVIGG